MKDVDVKNIPNVGSIIISDNLKKKIDYLHKYVGKLEWSGILLYKLVSGNISKMNNLIFKAVDLYPMDIGSTANTTFVYKPEEVVNMYDSITEAMELNTGLVHSHHSMSSFISGTDFSEIKDNANNYNFYISLVVSFDQEYVCKIAFPSQTIVKKTSKIRDNKGKWVTVTYKDESESLLLGDLTVVFESFSKIESWFTTKVSDLKKNKNAQQNRLAAYNNTGTGYTSSNWNNYYTSVDKVTAGVGRRHWNEFDDKQGMSKSFESMFSPQPIPIDKSEIEQDGNVSTLNPVEKLFMGIMGHDISAAGDLNSTDVYNEIAGLIEWENADWHVLNKDLEVNFYITHEDVYGPDDNNHSNHLIEVISMIEKIGKGEKSTRRLIRNLRELFTSTLIKIE